MVDVISFMGRKNLFLRRRRLRNRFCATISLVRNLSNHFKRPMLHLNSFLGTAPGDGGGGIYLQASEKFSNVVVAFMDGQKVRLIDLPIPTQSFDCINRHNRPIQTSRINMAERIGRLKNRTLKRTNTIA